MSSSLRIHLSHKTSLTAEAIDRYSASAEKRETTDCFLVFQEIGAPPSNARYLKMDDFLNPFSDAFAYTSSSGENTSSNTNENAPNPSPKKTIADSLSVDNAYGTYNKLPKLMVIEEYNRWANRFEEWLLAFAYQSWKSMKSGFNIGRTDYENLTDTPQENFIAEQKCITLLHQSVRDDIISLIEYKDSRDLWEKLKMKCVGGAEIVKNKKKLLKKEFDLFGCLKNESVSKMIERFGHLKLELARYEIVYTREELVDKLFDSLPDEKDWQYFALMLKNIVKSTDLTVDLLIERLESHELEIRKTNKVNNSSYQQNVDLYYRGSMIPKTVSPKTAFSAENSNMSNQESPSSGYHGGSSSTASRQQQQSIPKNMFQCNIAVDLKNAQNFSEESTKQQMVFLASVLESYESLVAGKIGNTNLTKEDYDQIDPEEMELIDIRWCMASAQKGHFKRECRNAVADETANPFCEDYYKRAIYHQNKSESPRMKQLEDAPKEKSRALAVIHDDEGYDWSDVLPEKDAVGYAFMAKIVPFKDTRSEEVKHVNRKMLAQTMKDRHFRAWKEAKSAKRWDADRECYLDPKGNILVEPSTLLVETLIEQIAEEEEANQRLWWGSEEEKEKELQSKKIDDGIIDTTKEFTAENLKKMADKVLAAKELEVESKSRTESKSKVSSNDSKNELGKTDKAESKSDCKNCMKDYKVCSTIAYLSGKKTEELTERVREVENQILSRDKLLKALNDRIKGLTDKIEKDKIDVERIRKENEKLVHENRQLSVNYEKLKRTTKDSDERNDKTVKENFQLTGVLQSKEKQINQQLDEIANLKLQFQEAKIENERINLKLNSYNSASYTMPPQNPGDSWRFNYDTLWDSFDMEEEPEFFDELDILREYESSQESNAGEHDDIQQSSERDHAPDNQTAVNENLESDNRPIFDCGDSDSEGEQIQISNQTIPVNEQGANQNVTNLEGEVDVPDEVMPRTLSYHPKELIIGELQSGWKADLQIHSLRQMQEVSKLEDELGAYYVKPVKLKSQNKFIKLKLVIQGH
ncbi:uncharacterized protein LOC110882178 [Helianthus annuus]|uniref:uncharacterized protein LOC110882178 n=1 Tax=Helianthus annuus TaxID=4232 RepID=UPI00165319B8|nr:uncharacterized protein LOC110882178 [Helianthus annuus]